MSKEFKLPRKWTEEVWFPALLSGEFKQGYSQLMTRTAILDEDDEPTGEYMDDAKYCCLGVAGVACGIDKELFGALSFIDTPSESTHTPQTRLREEALLKGYPRELLYESVKRASDAVVHREEDNSTLAEVLATMNDSCNDSFADIVEWIKENVELYD